MDQVIVAGDCLKWGVVVSSELSKKWTDFAWWWLDPLCWEWIDEAGLMSLWWDKWGDDFLIPWCNICPLPGLRLLKAPPWRAWTEPAFSWCNPLSCWLYLCNPLSCGNRGGCNPSPGYLYGWGRNGPHPWSLEVDLAPVQR